MSSCSALQTEHTTKLDNRTVEYFAASVRKDAMEKVNDAILKHLSDIGYQVDPAAAFKTALTTMEINTREIRKRFLRIAEVMATRILARDLCKQRNLAQPYSCLGQEKK